MLTRDDLIDAISRHLAEPPAIPNRKRPAHPPMLPKGRAFLSEHVIKKLLTPQAQHLTIAKDSIVSPLAADWLVLQGIRIVRE